jgi:hypothetical protein
MLIAALWSELHAGCGLWCLACSIGFLEHRPAFCEIYQAREGKNCRPLPRSRPDDGDDARLMELAYQCVGGLVIDVRPLAEFADLERGAFKKGIDYLRDIMQNRLFILHDAFAINNLDC